MLVFARERAFGGLLAQHGILHGRQFLAPLGLALFDFWGCFGIWHGTSFVDRLLSTVDLRLASVSPRLLIANGNKTAVESHIPLALTFVNKARSDECQSGTLVGDSCTHQGRLLDVILGENLLQVFDLRNVVIRN